MNDELPAGWALTTLEHVVTILDSMRIPLNKTERAERAGQVPYYGATGQVGWVDKPIFDEELVLLGEDGAPFLHFDRPKAYVISGPAWVNNHAHVLRAVLPATSNRFLLHYLNWFPYRGCVTGTTRLKLTQRAMRAISVRLPPRAEQERIVAAIEEHFSRLHFAEVALEAARSKLQALRRSVLAAAFSGRLTNPTHTTNADPGQLPGGWRWTTLRDLLEHTIGGAWGKPIDEDEVNVRVLRVTEFGKHTVLEPETGVVRAVSAKQLASRQLQLGDILLEKSGGGPNQPVGRVVAFRTHLAEPAVPTNFVQLLRPSRDVVDPAFLTWTLDWWHKNGTAEAHQRATTNIRNLQTKAYLAQPVAVPPRAEQEQVVATIEGHFSVLNAAETALDAVRAKVSGFRRSVLVEAFAGRLVPQDPDDEPAAVLLARIAAERPVRPTSRKRSK